MKSGKRFENNFKESVPSRIYCYRFRDGTASWNQSENTRFQCPNVCDFMMYDGVELYYLELKSHKGASVPFKAIYDVKKKNDKWKLDEMKKASSRGVIAGLLIEFSDKKRVFWLDIVEYIEYSKHSDRESLPISFLELEGYELDVRKMPINIALDINKFLEDFE